MPRWMKVLVTIEVVIAFAPMLVLLVLGVLVAPMQISAVLDEPLIWQGPAEVIGSVICGAIGFSTLLCLLGRLFADSHSPARRRLILTGCALGALPVVQIALFGESGGWRLAGILPLAVSAQILFQSRKMLFPSWVEGLKSAAIAAVAVLIPLSVLAFNPFSTSPATLEAQRALWQTAAPQQYEFSIQLSGSVEPEALNPKRIRIEGDRVISVAYAWSSPDHNAGDPAPALNLWTIERAFSEVSTAKLRGWNVSATFNERWGFIDRAFIETDSSSSGWDLKVSEFTVISE